MISAVTVNDTRMILLLNKQQRSVRSLNSTTTKIRVKKCMLCVRWIRFIIFQEAVTNTVTILLVKNRGKNKAFYHLWVRDIMPIKKYEPLPKNDKLRSRVSLKCMAHASIFWNLQGSQPSGEHRRMGLSSKKRATTSSLNAGVICQISVKYYNSKDRRIFLHAQTHF